VQKTNVRIVAATNMNMVEAIKKEKFREDLYYRLHVVELIVPPLRDRKEDIEDLISHFIGQFNEEYKKNIEGCSPEAMNLLINYDWPGNIRELEHVIEHSFAVTIGSQKTITFESLPAKLTGSNKPYSKTKPVKTKDVDEKSQLEEALINANGNKSQAARALGITRAGLYKKMQRFNL